MIVASVSYGNDSIALLQWLHEGRTAVTGRILCVYAATGWASKEWPTRVERGEALARSYGFEPYQVARAGGGVICFRVGYLRHSEQGPR